MRYKICLRFLAVGMLFCLLGSAVHAQVTGQSAQPKAGIAASKAKLVDINSATKDELAALPGIGDAYSQTIIDNRPYKVKTDLLNRKVLPQSVYRKISAKVIAKQSPTKQKPAPSASAEPTKAPVTAGAAKMPNAPDQHAPAAPQSQRATPPGKPILLAGNPMGPVKFEHSKHQVGCETCHHASRPEKPASVAQQGCTTCHTKPTAVGMKTGKQASFHNASATAGTCIDCHKKSGGEAPTKCAQCHSKANG